MGATVAGTDVHEGMGQQRTDRLGVGVSEAGALEPRAGSSSIDRSINSSAGVAPRPSDLAERAPDEILVAVEGDITDEVRRRFHARRRESRRRPGPSTSVWRAVIPRAASLSAGSFIDSTFHHPGMARNMMLRWAIVQEMSIGRSAPAATPRSARPRPLDRGHDLVRGVGGRRAVEQRRQRRGDAEPPRELGEQLGAAHGQPGVVELVDDLQHGHVRRGRRTAPPARCARRTGMAPAACRPPRRRSSSTARRHRRRGTRGARRHHRHLVGRGDAPGRRPARTSAARSARRAARR